MRPLGGLCGMAVLLVIAGHAGGTAGAPPITAMLAPLGDLGAKFLMVVVSYMITWRLAADIRDGRGSRALVAGRFCVRAAARIFPPCAAYLLALAAAVGAGLLWIPSADFAAAASVTANSEESLPWAMDHLWAFAALIQFCAVWPPVLALVGLRWGRWLAAACFLCAPAALTAFWFMADPSPIAMKHQIAATAVAFASGSFAAMAASDPRWARGLAMLTGPRPAVVWLLAAFAIPFAAYHCSPALFYTAGQSAMAICGALCAAGCAMHPRGPLARLAGSRFFAAHGAAACSLFLWQQPFLDTMEIHWFSRFPGNLAMAYATAAAGFFLVERPVRRLVLLILPTGYGAAAGARFEAAWVSLLCLAVAYVGSVRGEDPTVFFVATLVPIGLIAGVKFLLNPAIPVMVFICLSVFRLPEAVPFLGHFRLPNLFAMLAIASFALNVGVIRNVRTWWSRELTLLLLFFLHVTLCMVMATDHPGSFDYWSSTFVKIAVMTFAAVWLTRQPADFARLNRWVVLSGMVVAAVALSNRIQGIELVEGTRVTIGRSVHSTLGDPNDLSLVLLFPLAFACGQAFTRGLAIIDRLIGMVAIPAVLAAIIATQSRGGLFGVMAVMGTMFYRRSRSKTLLIVLGVLGSMALFAMAGISDRSSGGAAESGIDASSQGRLDAWKAAFHMALDHPLDGVGLNCFLQNYYAYIQTWGGHVHAVHSTWFAVLAETGFVGIGLFVTIVVIAVRMAIRTSNALDRSPGSPAVMRATGQAIVAGLAGFCVSGTFLTQGFTWFIYIQVALVLAFARWAALAGYVRAPAKGAVSAVGRAALAR
jgi:probable O-glycosylation ligase (exosortase A-associated)